MISLSRLLDLGVLLALAWAFGLAALRRHVAFTTARAKVAWWFLVALCAGTWLAMTPAVTLTLVHRLETAPVDLATLDDPAQRAHTALVVLSSSVGSPVAGDTPLERLDPAGTARTIGAARVWRRLRTGAVIVTGRAPGDDADATVRAMADLLVMHGVPRERVLLEPWALNTRQNALHSVRMGRRQGYTRYLVVTSALHMPRAMREFRRAGVVATAVPVNHLGGHIGGVSDWLPTAWSLGTMHAVLHEYLGMLKP